MTTFMRILLSGVVSIYAGALAIDDANAQAVGGGGAPQPAGIGNASDAVATTGAPGNLPAVVFLMGYNGTTYDRLQVDGSKNLKVNCITGCSATTAITPTVSTVNTDATKVFKASPGTVTAAYATNETTTAGFFMLFNATAAPADGAVTPLACVPLPASQVASISGPAPINFTTGISAAVSSGADCFTKTTGVIKAFFSGMTT
jgi:hypothetical protein